MATAATCTRHSGEETYLSCSTCERPFCFQCLTQGPVGAKCADCAKGRPIDSTKGDRAKFAAKEISGNRRMSLYLVIAAVGIANLIMMQGSNQAFSAVLGPVRYSLSRSAVRREPWRFFVGAIAHGSVIGLAISLAGMWWVGQHLAPRLRNLRMFSILVASFVGGAFAVLLLGDGTPSYGGLAGTAGLLGALVAGKKRGTIGAISLPGSMSRFGLFQLAIVWYLFGALFSGTTSLLAMVGGAAVGGALGWWMLKRPLVVTVKPTGDEVRHAAVGLVVAGLCIAGGFASAQMKSVVKVPTGPGQSVELDPAVQVEELLKAQRNPYAPPGGSIYISQWEDRNDPGDVQVFELKCESTPSMTDPFAPGEQFDAAGACDWLRANPKFHNLKETCPDDVFAGELMVVGDLDSKRLDASVPLDLFGVDKTASMKCPSALAREASKALLGS